MLHSCAKLPSFLLSAVFEFDVCRLCSITSRGRNRVVFRLDNQEDVWTVSKSSGNCLQASQMDKFASILSLEHKCFWTLQAVNTWTRSLYQQKPTTNLFAGSKSQSFPSEQTQRKTLRPLQHLIPPLWTLPKPMWTGSRGEICLGKPGAGKQ